MTNTCANRAQTAITKIAIVYYTYGFSMHAKCSEVIRYETLGAVHKVCYVKVAIFQTTLPALAYVT